MGIVSDMTDISPTPSPSAPAKAGVLEELGHESLVLPTLVNRGLVANDRAKYLLSLLQAARSHADAPSGPCSSLHAERLAAGVADAQLDSVVEASSRVGGGGELYLIPGAARIHEQLADSIGEMLAPLRTADLDGSSDTDRPDLGRLDALVTCAPDLSADLVPGDYIDRITSTVGPAGDSLHQLVMDAHRSLNRLQAEIATTYVDGAAAYGLEDDDHALVAAFMAGVHDTEHLKLEHPGLMATATNANGRLLIENDLGTTSEHVIVVSVEQLTVTVTYSDVHRRRLQFFVSLFDGYDVQWSDACRHGSASLGEHHVATGRYDAPDRPSLERYLRYLGSRLVFVIDWNRARKRLSTFLDRDDAIQILRWAADENVGHMSFLVMGAERLIYDAVELAAKGPARYGETLTDVLGREPTLEVTRFALRAAAEGLTAGKSHLLDPRRAAGRGHAPCRGGPAAIPRLGLRTRQPRRRDGPGPPHGARPPGHSAG